MDEAAALISTILDVIGRDELRQYSLRTIEPDRALGELRQHAFHAGSAFVPFANEEDGSWLSVHLVPRQTLQRGAVMLIDNDFRIPIAGALEHLPAALMIMRWGRPQAAPIPDSGALVEHLRSLPQDWLGSWATPHVAATREAWRLGAIEHPFEQFPDLPDLPRAAQVAGKFRPYLQDQKASVEMTAVAVSVLLRAKEDVPKEILERIFGAEWLTTTTIVSGARLRTHGEGIVDLDAVLANLGPQIELLRGTPFEPLIEHPRAYSGSDPEGPKTLQEVADRLDPPGALRQLRNALTVTIIGRLKGRRELEERIAEVTNVIEPGGPAAIMAGACLELSGQPL